MEQFVSQDPRSYSLYFDLNIWFRARKVTGTFEKRAPEPDELISLAQIHIHKLVGIKTARPPWARLANVSQ